MTPDLIERAFDPFFTTKASGSGTGLGLAMCASIVRRAGGFITVDSLPGKGATFRVHLPVAANHGARTGRPPADLDQPRDPVTPPPEARPIGTVLVVEDNEPVRNLIASVLGALGLRVLEASDLRTARAHLQAGPVDLLLTDGGLPDGHGLDLVHEAQQQRRVRRVVLMSGVPPDASQIDRIGRLEIDGVVPKPFRVETLVATVSRLLREDRD
jgi:CheY-like chemotaxis protein